MGGWGTQLAWSVGRQINFRAFEHFAKYQLPYSHTLHSVVNCLHFRNPRVWLTSFPPIMLFFQVRYQLIFPFSPELINMRETAILHAPFQPGGRRGLYIIPLISRGDQSMERRTQTELLRQQEFYSLPFLPRKDALVCSDDFPLFPLRLGFDGR